MVSVSGLVASYRQCVLGFFYLGMVRVTVEVQLWCRLRWSCKFGLRLHGRRRCFLPKDFLQVVICRTKSGHPAVRS